MSKMKTKFLLQGQNQTLEDFEEQVNTWTEDKRVITIQYQSNIGGSGAFVFTRLSVMVLYDERQKERRVEHPFIHRYDA